MLHQMIEDFQRRRRSARTWNSPVGRDCVSLDIALCRWLGERLVYLSQHVNAWPHDSTPEDWADTLQGRGEDLLAWAKHLRIDDADEEAQAYLRAQDALHWVAEHMSDLWFMPYAPSPLPREKADG